MISPITNRTLKRQTLEERFVDLWESKTEEIAN